MKDFIYQLYQNDKFLIITCCILVFLIICFVIVYFCGKKDKVIQDTKRLQKLNLDAFKEESGKEEKVEVAVLPENVNESEKVVEEIQKEEPLLNEEANITVFEPKDEIVIPEVEEQEEAVPVMHKPLFSDHEEEESPINLNELPLLNDEDKKMENGLNVLENIKNEFAKIEIPDVEDNEEVVKPVESEKVYKPGPQIFSSVYVNNNKEESVVKVDSDVVDTKVEDNNIDDDNGFGSKLFTIEDDDDEIELPSLKNDDKPLFDDNLGETYEIK